MTEITSRCTCSYTNGHGEFGRVIHPERIGCQRRMITATPTSYEIYDDDAQQALAKIVMFDEGASNVEIITVVDPASWTELSAVILDALKQMHPDKPSSQGEDK